MTDAENFWNQRLEKLRRFKGLCPLTPDEAAKLLKKFSHRKASKDEIDSIVDAVTRGELPRCDDPPQADWSPEYNHSEIDSDAVLFRNEGDENPEADALEQELLEELLDDDDAKDDRNRLED